MKNGINSILIPVKDLNEEQKKLMLELNRAVVALCKEHKRIFHFAPDLNMGNIGLIDQLAANPDILVSYEFKNLVDFYEGGLWLNVHFRLTFPTVQVDYNGPETSWNVIDLTPKQTVQVFRTIKNGLAQSELLRYSREVCESISQAAGRVKEFADRANMNFDSTEKDLPILDQATNPVGAAVFSTAIVYGTRYAFRSLGELCRRFGQW